MDLVRRLKPVHMRLIAAIAQHRKLAIAAASLSISQPAASRMLAEIETEAGAALFLRHPRFMEPTPVGAAYLRHLRVILAEIENLQTEVRNLNEGLAGELRVGAVTGPAMAFLMPALRRIKEAAPDIEPTIEVGPSAPLVRGLREGRLDLVIARLPPDQHSRDFHIYPARSEKVSLLVGEDHPMAGRAKVPLADLLGFEWVIQERGSPIRQSVEDGFLRAGLPVPGNVYNSSSLLVVLSLIAQGHVISPQSEEVGEILCGTALGARLTLLNVETTFNVSPYFVLVNRGQQLPPVAERVLHEVLRGI